MRHPSEYSTTPWFGLHIMAVDAGTVVTDERTGQKVTIDDQTSCRKGTTVFCTDKTFELLKAVAKAKP